MGYATLEIVAALTVMAAANLGKRFLAPVVPPDRLTLLVWRRGVGPCVVK
jgi:hypothetical protein